MIVVKELDLNDLVRANGAMLARLLGEDIRFDLRLDERPCRTRADATQIEQVLLNLAVNARDAMPHGGHLTIATSAEPRPLADMQGLMAPPESAGTGPYVTLTVQDTGTGIEPDVLEHIFEPFFTTKAFGHGTGLGLATVHGIVHQHEASSEP